jgi:hypothetical protein
MGFNKFFVPEPTEVVRQVKLNGPTKFINRKIDAVIGNTTSIKMLDHIELEVNSGKLDKQILISLCKKFPKYFNA